MRFIITAGGTGGHIMPAIAIAEAIKTKLPDSKILFIGTDRGMEEKVSRMAGLDFIPIKAMGIKGKSLKNIIKSLKINTRAFITAFKIIKGFCPDWVIGTGGYITGMVILAGRFLGARCAIQEQNSIPGLTNRILSRISHKIFLAFPDTSHQFPVQKTIQTGNPLRKEITAFNGVNPGKHLLILGGSLGASSINHISLEALKILKDEGHTIQVIHQTGSEDFSWVNKAYTELGIQAEVYDFIFDMASVYKRGSLALCRCGGLTLSELSRVGMPAIMVPYPHATDNHQMKNALYVAANDGGWIIPDNNLSSGRLALEIKTRFFDQQELMNASIHMKNMLIGNGAEKIAQEIVSV